MELLYLYYVFQFDYSELFDAAYFGTFCIQIGWKFEPRWVIEDSLKSEILTLSILQRLGVVRIFDKFGCNWA